MEQLISKVVEGYHATVFAYGQTGWEFGDSRPTDAGHVCTKKPFNFGSKCLEKDDGNAEH